MDHMYKRRRRFPIVYVVVIVGIGTLWATGSWPFERGRSITARIPTIADGVRRAYEGLSADFRSKVAEDDFAAMFESMVGLHAGVLRIRGASASDAIGPERARARLTVDYPDAQATATYEFERLDEGWQLQSFSRRDPHDERNPAPSRPEFARKPEAPAPVAPAPEPPAAAPRPPPPTGRAPGPRPAATQPPRARRTHIIQAGDTLWDIARKYYGSYAHVDHIKAANPGLNPKRLRIGQRITIPSLPEKTPRPPRPGA